MRQITTAKFLLFLAILLKTTTSFCQLAAEEIIIGEWTSRDHLGDSVKLSFNKNKTMYIFHSVKGFMGKGETTMEDGRKVNILMKYEFNLKERPIHIDFYFYVDNFYNPVGKTEGILEILGENTIWIAMNNNRQASARPKNFRNSVEAILLSRTNIKNEVKGCENFKEGKFKLLDPVVGTVAIERKGNIQMQTLENGGKQNFGLNGLMIATTT